MPTQALAAGAPETASDRQLADVTAGLHRANDQRQARVVVSRRKKCRRERCAALHCQPTRPLVLVPVLLAQSLHEHLIVGQALPPLIHSVTREDSVACSIASFAVSSGTDRA